MTETPESLMKIAQRVHDEYVEEGQKKKQEIIQEAENKANNIKEQVEQYAQELSKKAEQEYTEATELKNKEIKKLEERINTLKTLEENFSKELILLINKTTHVLDERIIEDNKYSVNNDDESEKYLDDLMSNPDDEEQYTKNSEYKKQAPLQNPKNNVKNNNETEYTPEEIEEKSEEALNTIELDSNPDDRNDTRDYSDKEIEYDNELLTSQQPEVSESKEEEK